MSPVVGGGAAVDPHVAAAYGPQAASFTPVSASPQGNGGLGSGGASGGGAPIWSPVSVRRTWAWGRLIGLTMERSFWPRAMLVGSK